IDKALKRIKCSTSKGQCGQSGGWGAVEREIALAANRNRGRSGNSRARTQGQCSLKNRCLSGVRKGVGQSQIAGASYLDQRGGPELTTFRFVHYDAIECLLAGQLTNLIERGPERGIFVAAENRVRSPGH